MRYDLRTPGWRADRIGISMTSLRNFGFLLKDISRLFALNFERHADGLGLTLSECRVLCYLQRNQGITQVRLAHLTDTAPMTLVRILDHMERAGLIERRSDPGDRRARRLHLCAPAQPALRRIWRISDKARDEMLAVLSGPERAQLLGLVRRIHGNLDTLLPGAAEAGTNASRKPRRRHAAKGAAPC